MRLTREEGGLLLGAISAELESQKYRALRREQYGNAYTDSWRRVEGGIRRQDEERAAELCRVRDKIEGQI